jgi:hypothetical protein
MNIFFIKRKRISKIIFFAVLLLLGLLYRFWIVNLSPQPLLIGDQYDYNRFGAEIVNHGIYALSTRLYGYPIFLGLIYSVFGLQNLQAVIIVQAVIDTLTALFLYLLGTSIFKGKKISFIAFILYLLNPFTAACTGVIMTEVLSIFILVISFYFFILFSKRNSVLFLFISAGFLGYLTQVKPAFQIYSFVFLLFGIYLMVKKFTFRKIKLFIYMILLFLIYFLPYTYTLIGNKIYFNEYNLSNVENIFFVSFYNSIFLEKGFPPKETYVETRFQGFPKEIIGSINDYDAYKYTKEGREMVGKKYSMLAIKAITDNPKNYLLSRIRKVGYIWDKSTVYLFVEKADYIRSAFLHYVNIILLILACFGFFIWGKYLCSKPKNVEFYIFLLIIILVIYISIMNSLLTGADERYSLPAYPFVFLLDGFFINWLIERFKLHKNDE